MKKCDGQFLWATREVSKKYPHIKYEEMIIDNCCMQLIINPWQFDVLVMPNLYGAIVSNIGLGITGGPGLTPGCMVGQKYSIFEIVLIINNIRVEDMEEEILQERISLIRLRFYSLMLCY